MLICRAVEDESPASKPDPASSCDEPGCPEVENRVIVRL